ncbi:uncharacterized protein [Paramormyrops kingsleyae]|uniref:uncharacterized protein n=1 Tax=Paramormyrops kingsleyae TaxID=1676925 RepID=UPI003B975781
MKPNVTSNFPWGGKEVASICSNSCLYIMALMHIPAQNVSVELSDDSDFESPALQRRRVIQQEAPQSTSQREAPERHEGVAANTPADEGLNLLQANVHFADFIPVNLEEDEAVEEAIRLSLLEEAVQPLHDSRITLSREEMTGIVKAHSERVVTSAFRPIHISRGYLWTTALRQFSRRKFAESTDMLYVTFASDEDTAEDADDLGGPRREFFRLLVKAIYTESGAFEEAPNGFVPRMNISDDVYHNSPGW